MTALPKTSIALGFKIEPQSSKTYRYDFEAKRIIGTVDGLHAMVQAVRKAINTIRYSERIYSGGYGSEIHALIGRGLPYVEATIRQVLTETFQDDSRIKAIKKCKVERTTSDTLTVTAELLTEYGEIYLTHGLEG